MAAASAGSNTNHHEQYVLQNESQHTIVKNTTLSQQESSFFGNPSISAATEIAGDMMTASSISQTRNSGTIPTTVIGSQQSQQNQQQPIRYQQIPSNTLILQENQQLMQQQLQLQQQTGQQMQLQNHVQIQHSQPQQQIQEYIPRVGNVQQQSNQIHHTQHFQQSKHEPSVQLIERSLANITGGSTLTNNVTIRQVSNSNNTNVLNSTPIMVASAVAGPTAAHNILNTNMVHQSHQQQGFLNHLNSIIPKQQQQQIINNLSANLAPGWRRVILNTEVVYVSPTGASLRTHQQIKDYLLASGTCKCGLPCPLRPEYFFDFNSQVPNTLVKSPLENGLQSSRSSSALMCVHQRKRFESQKILFHKDGTTKKRKAVDASETSVFSYGKVSATPLTQCNSVAIYSAGNVMQTSQITDQQHLYQQPHMQQTRQQQKQQQHQQQQEKKQQQQQKQPHQPQQEPLTGELMANVSNLQQNKQMENQQHQVLEINNKINSKQIGSVTLSKTPPWRKNSMIQQTSQQDQTQEFENIPSQTQSIYPSPTASSCVNIANNTLSRISQLTSQQNTTPPWHDNSLIGKTNSSVTIISSKKKAPPNFKDDPTGYMNQQTAILHNSIMNVVQSSDFNDDVIEPLTSQNRQLNQEQESTFKTDKTGLVNCNNETVINKHKQNNLCLNSSSRQLTDAVNKDINNPKIQDMTGDTTKVSTQFICTPQQIRKNYLDDSPGKILNQLKQIVNQTSQQSNSSLSHIFNKTSTKNTVTGILGQNLIDGQIITHYPNGMVQVEQNDANSTLIEEQEQQQENQSITRVNEDLFNKMKQQILHQQHEQISHQTIQIQHGNHIQKQKNQREHVTLSPPISQNQQNLILKPSLQQKITGGKQIIDYTEYVDDTQKAQNLNGQQIIILHSQESPVSSSSSGVISSHKRLTPEIKFSVPSSSISPAPSNSSTSSSMSTILDNRPPQVGAVSTSYESPRPAESPEMGTVPTSKRIIPPRSSPMLLNSIAHSLTLTQNQKSFAPTTTSISRNTITSVQAGKHQTTTATATSSATNKIIIESTSGTVHHSQKLSPNSMIPVSSLQLHQTVTQEPGSQLIMTSTGQIIVMPSSPAKSQKNTNTNQILISTGGNNVTTNSANTQSSKQNLILTQNASNALQQQQISPQPQVHNTAYAAIQSPNLNQQNIIQSQNNLLSPTQNQSTTNFIVNSSPQQMILNNGNIIHHQSNNQNMINSHSAVGSSNLISNNGTGTKIMSNPAVLGGTSQVMQNSASIISSNNTQILGQQNQQVVVNTLPNGSYVIQHQPNNTAQTNASYTTTVDGQVVSIQDNTSTTFTQQGQSTQQRHIIITSPDSSKRKAKKRKGSSTSSSPTTISSLSPQQSPTTIIQQPQVVQIAAPQQYQTQQFQISSGIQQIMVNKAAHQAGPQQQIFIQNGQILQPVNMIGQQILVPAGTNLLTQQLLVPTDSTLLQIQNMGMSSSIITQQGMVLRTPSPQNKQFLSPTGTGQQFIVNSNSQMSPIGQIYGTPMSLMVPNSAGTTTTFVQQNPTTSVIQQQQPQGQILNQSQITQQQPQGIVTNQININQNHNVITLNEHVNRVSPPDTTTHSPRSPERPASQKSGGSDMVQCVSSSEPDSVVSPSILESSQSPTTTSDFDKSISQLYRNPTNNYKPSEPKTKSTETPTNFKNRDKKPDYHESPTNLPTSLLSSVTSPLPTVLLSPVSSLPIKRTRRCANNNNNNNNINNNSNSYSNINNNTNTVILNNGQIHKSYNSNNNNHSFFNNSLVNYNTNNNCSHKINYNKNNNNNKNNMNNNNNDDIKSVTSYPIGELVWGAAKGYPGWPGKIVNAPSGLSTASDSTWVQWFGGRPTVELCTISSLKSLSEGFEAHHKAQKDTRKSRKLNPQLDRAIQHALDELDRISVINQSQSSSISSNSTAKISKSTRSTKYVVNVNSSISQNHQQLMQSQQQQAHFNTTTTSTVYQKSKPIKIAPAPTLSPTGHDVVNTNHKKKLQEQTETNSTATNNIIK